MDSRKTKTKDLRHMNIKNFNYFCETLAKRIEA